MAWTARERAEPHRDNAVKLAGHTMPPASSAARPAQWSRHAASAFAEDGRIRPDLASSGKGNRCWADTTRCTSADVPAPSTRAIRNHDQRREPPLSCSFSTAPNSRANLASRLKRVALTARCAPRCGPPAGCGGGAAHVRLVVLSHIRVGASWPRTTIRDLSNDARYIDDAPTNQSNPSLDLLAPGKSRPDWHLSP